MTNYKSQHDQSTLRYRGCASLSFRVGCLKKKIADTTAFIFDDKKMTKGKITSSTTQWLALPCVFLQTESLIEKCTYCEEKFTFWSSRKHCEFCGCVVHSRCTVKVGTPEGRRAKMCQRCHTYKMVHCQHLTEGMNRHSY